MKFWSILALVVAICAVLLGVGHTEEAAQLDDFKGKSLNDAASYGEKDNEIENALESVNEAPSADEDEPAKFKRTPLWRRRRRRRRWIRFRFRFRRVLRRVCRWVYVSGHGGYQYKCFLANRFLGDEESPRSAASTEQDEPWLGEE